MTPTAETDDATLEAIRDYITRSAAEKDKFIVQSDRFGRPSDITTTEGHRILAQYRQQFNDKELRIMMQVNSNCYNVISAKFLWDDLFLMWSLLDTYH